MLRNQSSTGPQKVHPMQDTNAPTLDSSVHMNGPESTLEELSQPVFNASQCVFCHVTATSLSSNITHMLKTHGFMIPEQDRLLVELDTFVSYLHMVVSSDFECLHCGAQRSNSEAVRQHMMAKGHCKIDVADPESEFRDFYRVDSFGCEDGDDQVALEEMNLVTLSPQRVDETTVRLSSGKMLFHKDYRPPRHHHRVRRSPEPSHTTVKLEAIPPDPEENSEMSATDQNPGSLRRVEKRAVALDKRMSQLRASDVRSLAHLPTSQQRAQLLTQSKQIDSVRRAQRAMGLRMQMMGNQTLMKHFVNDVPGPKLG